MQETNGSGTTPSYVLAGSEPLAQTRGGVTSYYLHDGQGSVRTLTNASGTVTDGNAYDAFGNAYLPGTSGSTTNLYRDTGQQLDQTGLYDLRAPASLDDWTIA